MLAGDAAAAPAPDLEGVQFVAYQSATALPQLQWEVPGIGPVLLVSLCSNLAPVTLGLLALGVVFVAVAAESDPASSEWVSQAFRNVVRIDDARAFDVQCLQAVLAQKRFSAILVVGGSPCRTASVAAKSQQDLAPYVAQQCRDLLQASSRKIPVLAVVVRPQCEPDEQIQKNQSSHVRAARCPKRGLLRLPRPEQLLALDFGWQVLSGIL